LSNIAQKLIPQKEMIIIKTNLQKAYGHAIAGSLLLILLLVVSVYESEQILIRLIFLGFGIVSIKGFIYSFQDGKEIKSKKKKIVLMANFVLSLLYLSILVYYVIGKIRE
jgi:uncharacterized integral membrane protein